MSLGQILPTRVQVPHDPVAPAPKSPAATAAVATSQPRVVTHASPAGDLGWSRIFIGIALYVVICWTVDAVAIRLFPATPRTRFISGSVVLMILLAVLSWPARLRQAVLHALSTVQFAVALLAVVGLATVAGTWILQGEELASYQANYGSTLTDLIFEAGFEDLFHSLWFGGLLVLLAFSLVVTIYRHKAWRLPTLGLFLSHFGVITIVAGGLTGYAGGFKGFIDLHEGEATQQATLASHGRPTQAHQSFDFALRLDKFDIEKYPAKNKLYLYHQAGETWRPLMALEPVHAEKWTTIMGSDSAFRVRQLFPDFVMETRLEPVEPTLTPIGPVNPDFVGKTGAPAQSASAGFPGVEVRVRKGERAHTLALGAGGPDRVRLADNGPALRFCPTAPTADMMAAWSAAQPTQHQLIVPPQAGAAGTVEPTTLTVELGKTYPFGPAAQVAVLEFIPDFSFDVDTKKVSSRSTQPQNPALLVQITRLGEEAQPPQWLFANMPDFSMGKGGTMLKNLPFTYSYRPGETGDHQSFVIVGDQSSLWEVQNGAVLNHRVLTPNMPLTADLAIVTAKVLPCARVTRHAASQSTAMLNPVVELDVRNGNETTTELLSTRHSEPYAFSDGQNLLTFEAGADEVKAYRSHVSIIENGEVVKSEIVAVNHPLEYKGLQFYQSNYRKDDPTYSGFQVVHDPGLNLVWGGLVMISLGVVYNYYLRPRLTGRHTHDA